MTTKAEKEAAEAAVANAGEGETTRPTGKNAEQDADIAAVMATNEMLTKQMAQMSEQMAAITAALAANGAAPAAKTKPTLGIINNDEASKAVLAARAKEPKTYRATQDGTDLTQGFIPAGTVFTTTQPKGSWMEPVE